MDLKTARKMLTNHDRDARRAKANGRPGPVETSAIAEARHVEHASLVAHPDEIAMVIVSQVLRKRLDQETTDAIANELLNQGVVFRMANWWMENYYHPARAWAEAPIVADESE